MVELKEYLEIVFVIIALVFMVYTYTRDYYLEEDRSKVKSAGILAALLVFIIVIIAYIIYKIFP